MNDYELYHHGVKGQKWGIRRTAAQLGHRVAGAAKAAGKAVGKGASKAGKAAKKAAVAKAKQVHAENKEKRYYEKLHKKKLSQMTDKEIKDLTDRVKREATLKDAKYESRVQNARKFYKNVAQQPMNDILKEYGRSAVRAAFKDNSKTPVQGEQPEKVSTTVTGRAKKLADRVNSRPDKRPQRGTANSFNNPVTIRHGR